MVEVKQISNEKKYDAILNYMKLTESYVVPLVRENLGEQKVEELKKIWREQQKQISEDASSEEKYETAFSNWLRKWENSYDFVRKNLGEKGTEKFKRLAIEAIKKDIPSPAVYFLGIMKVISPKSAFKAIAKQIINQTQVFTPFSVIELTNNRLVLDIPHCKVLEHPCGENFCAVGCQEISTAPLRELLKVNMTMNRQGENCRATCIPL
ncbi:MAG: hypothetical protein MUO82_06935 [Candidatus Thermoplasmatota archaeon]|nr:hypothetical protein [Candidatus Thermoplasmatota archaeon]